MTMLQVRPAVWRSQTPDRGRTRAAAEHRLSRTDAVALRRKYGNSLGLVGAIDKRMLAKDKKAIEEEVMSKVPFLVETGGFIPTCDHAVPPDVSLENYLYYLDLIHKIAEGK